MTSQRVERTWISTDGYGRFRGEWVNTNCILQGRMEDFVIGGPRDIAYSGNMGAIAPIRTANGALFGGVSSVCSSGKVFEIEVI